MDCLCIECGLPIKRRSAAPEARRHGGALAMRCVSCAARRVQDRLWSSGTTQEFYARLSDHEDEKREHNRIKDEMLVQRVFSFPVFGTTLPMAHGIATRADPTERAPGSYQHVRQKCQREGCTNVRVRGIAYCFDDRELAEVQPEKKEESQ